MLIRIETQNKAYIIDGEVCIMSRPDRDGKIAELQVDSAYHKFVFDNVIVYPSSKFEVYGAGTLDNKHSYRLIPIGTKEVPATVLSEP